MGFYFSSLLGTDKVTGKYMGVGYGDEEGKTRPPPPPMPCLPKHTFSREKQFGLYNPKFHRLDPFLIFFIFIFSEKLKKNCINFI
ncbi:hypothetical protein MTR_7g093620 [Medicago truncatula]|uniref:Uncharacterized protein n=1 Tax=Medicago truncatula TaxID=3880 RepID=G7KWA5_MEDTR|nr:hypothetical protein MTR_7g093620 [Medicago truncatula]